MFKRLISMLLALSLLISVCPVYAAAETTEETEAAVVELVPETTEAPVETEPMAEPEESVIEEEPEEPVVETEPEETVIETEPAETVIETEPEKTVVETEPEETVTETVPEETVVETVPEETVVETEPEVVVTEPEAADTTYETFEVGETKEVVIPSGESVTYQVTVTEAGEYTFYDDSDESNMPEWYIYDSEDNLVRNAWRKMTVSLEADTVYQLVVENYYAYDFDCDLKFIERANATQVNFYDTKYVGMVGELVGLGYGMSPWYSHDVPVVTSSDESVVKIDNVTLDEDFASGNITFEIIGVGSAIITATTADGYTDTLTVVGVEPIELEENVPVTVDMVEDEYTYFSFSPETAGYYTFWETHDNDNHVSLYVNYWDEYDSYGESGSGSVCIYMEAGSECTVRANTWEDTTLTMTVAKSVDPESIIFPKTEMTVQAGETVCIPYELAPVNAKEVSITWTSSDETIAWYGWNGGDDGVYFYTGDNTGTATITATTENGLSAECTITVEAKPEMKLNETVTGTLAAYDEEETRYTYVFTAPATATYVLTALEDTDSAWEVQEEDGAWIGSRWVNSNSSLFFSCEEGVRYELTVRNWQNESVYYAVQLVEAVDPESIYFHQNNRTGFVGQKVDIDFNFGPSNGDPSKIQWAVSNEELAAIDYIGNGYVEVKLKAAGTVMVTATLPNGNAATATITVKAPEGELVIGEPLELGVGQNGTTAVTFTAPAEGSYAFWNSTEMNCYIRVIHPEGYAEGSGNTNCSAYLEEGVTYLVIVNNYTSTHPVLSVANCVKAQDISFKASEYSGYVGEYVYAELAWHPVNSIYENVEWVSSDPSVAEIEWYNDRTADIKLLKEGTVTITATTDSGLTAQCTVTVKSSIPLNVGDQQVVTLAPEDTIAYSFTAPADGSYIFWNDSDPYLEISIRNQTTGEYTYGDYKFVMEASKGDVFNILCRSYQDSTFTYILNLDEAVEATSISLSREAFTGYADDYVYVEANVQPGNAGSTVTWTSSNEDVAVVMGNSSSGANIAMLKAGTTTITATTDNGLSDSFELTVEEPEIISAPYSTTVTVPAQGQHVFLFTPEESGYYAFWNDSDYYCNIEVQELGNFYIGSKDNQFSFYATAGTTYLLKVYCWSDRAMTYNLHLDTCVDLQSIELDTTNISGMAGSSYYLNLFVTPGNAYYETVKWEIADTSIADINYSGDGYASINLKKAGTTTITADVDGITATATIRVVEPIVIEAPYSQTFSVKTGDTLAFRFTAPKTATYVMWDASEEGAYPEIHVRFPNGNGVGNGYRVQFDAVKGATYDITVRNWNFDGDLKLRLKEAVEPTDVGFVATKASGWSDTYFYLETFMTPVNADMSDMEVTVDDTSIAEVTFVSETNIGLYLKKAGTAKVTLSCGDAKDSCTITVKQSKTIAAGDEKTLTMEAWGEMMYQFTPSQSGSYVLWEEDYQLLNFNVVDSNGMYIDWDRSHLQFNANAGETYSIYVFNPYNKETTFGINLDKTAPLTGLDIGNGTVNAVVDQQWFFIPECEPANGDLFGIYWTVDNSSVAFIEDPYADTASVICIGEGTVTLTATVGDLSDSVKIVVESGELVAPTVKITNDTETGKPKLTWNDVPGAAEYKVYRATSKSGTYKLQKTTTDTSYVNTSAVAEKTYYYYVVAVSAAGTKSDKSTIVSRMCDLAQPQIKLTNIASSGKIKVSWDAVDGAAEYKVYRATSENGTYSLVKTTTSTSYTNTSAAAGKTYYYKVRAIADNTSANSAYSEIDSLICTLARPDVTLSSVASTGKIKVAWEAIDDAAAYEIYRATSEDGEYTLVKTTEDITWTDDTAVAGTAYYYRVKALAEKAAADSALSTVDSRTCDLARPTLTLTSDAASGKNIASWTAVEGAVEYRLYRATSKSGTYTKIAEIEGTTYTDTAATAGKTYYYKVLAVAEKSAANSAYSSIKSRTCDLAQPVVTLSNVSSSGKIKVSWKAVTNAVEYKVYRATSEDGTYSLVKTTTSTSYTNTSAVAGKTYYYKVRAIADNTSANSAYSAIKGRICKLERTTVTLSNISSSGKIKVSWTAVDDAVRYDIYRSESSSTGFELVKQSESTSWTDTTAEAEKTYYYKVKAIPENEDAASAYSSVKNRICKLARPDVTIELSSKGKPKLSWEAVEGAISYKVYRAASKSGTYSLVKTTTSTSYTNTGATSGKTYYYKVRAISTDADANSAYSSIDSIKSK